jgi:hypothetical protein
VVQQHMVLLVMLEVLVMELNTPQVVVVAL